MSVQLKTCRSGRHIYMPKDKGNKQGCPECATERRGRNGEARAEQLSRWRRENPAAHAEIARRAKLKRMGLTVREFDRLLAEQDCRCPICMNAIAVAGRVRDFDHDAVVDHDHSTGVIRGLLCHRCNMALGLLRDDFDALERAVAYLRRGVMSDVVG